MGSGVTLEVHEHERLVIGQECRIAGGGTTDFEARYWDALARYSESAAHGAFHVGHRSITVGHHVGYLQVDNVRVEVLPKLRKAGEGDWRGLLVHMLREVLGLRIAVHQHAPLRARSGHLYRVLVDRFLHLVETLIREGLVRSYREVQGNERCLRGRLVANRHFRENVAHRERLFVAYPVFDADNLVNRIVREALVRVGQTTGDDGQRASSEALLGALPPEVGRRRVCAGDFDRLRLNRSTERYREALDLARLILMSERPDLRWGGSPVLSLLFDMNALFEAYVLRQLRCLPGVRVRAQATRVFWKAVEGRRHMAKPDLLVTLPNQREPLVIDTKWKVPDGDRPSDDDLRQLFAYQRAFGAARGVLLYPRANAAQRSADGVFVADGLRGGVAFVDLLRDGHADRNVARASLAGLLGMEGVAGGRGA